MKRSSLWYLPGESSFSIAEPLIGLLSKRHTLMKMRARERSEKRKETKGSIRELLMKSLVNPQLMMSALDEPRNQRPVPSVFICSRISGKDRIEKEPKEKEETNEKQINFQKDCFEDL